MPMVIAKVKVSNTMSNNYSKGIKVKSLSEFEEAFFIICNDS